MVGRIVGLSLAGGIILALVILGIANLITPTTTKEEAKKDGGQVEIGRHVAVRVTDKEIILLDTVDGSLYRAKEEDIKPYKEIFPTENKEESDDSDSE